jgi:transcriptional regulator with XRE-family HTH domain
MTEKEHIIKETRTKKGLSIRKLAAKADIDPTVLHEYETGIRDTRSLNLIRILVALDIDLSPVFE